MCMLSQLDLRLWYQHRRNLPQLGLAPIFFYSYDHFGIGDWDDTILDMHLYTNYKDRNVSHK